METNNEPVNGWTQDVETVLENIRLNCITLSGLHKEKFYHYKGHLKYFKLPLIVLSSVNSIASVGLTAYLHQETISMITCMLSLVSAVIASVELYLGVQKNMESELFASRNFQLLAYDIFKTLSLKVNHRQVGGKVYLEEKYNEYIKLTEQANLIRNKKVTDSLAPLPLNYKLPSSPSSLSNLKTFITRSTSNSESSEEVPGITLNNISNC